jgi:enoyl-CoA hydratase/carnithine racemase
MMSGTIEFERRGSTVVLTIAHEAKRNAFTQTMTQRLSELLRQAEDDRTVRAIVITGKGDVAFSSGHDLREMIAHPEHAADASLNDAFVMPARLRTPTIAAINGYAYAAGFILAINSDLRICSEGAAFAAPGARIGLLPIGGHLSRLPLLLPRAIAHELLVTCREMKAEEAHRLGFVSRVVPKEGLLDAALALADAIGRNSSAVIREIKGGLETLSADGPAAATTFEWAAGEKLQNAPDAREGVSAFLEKRTPVFQ